MDPAVASAFQELSRLPRSPPELTAEHCETALTLANQILKALPSDADATVAAGCALVHLQRYEEALAMVQPLLKAPSVSGTGTPLQRSDAEAVVAYALYRLHRLNEAAELCGENSSLRLQILYRKENFKVASQIAAAQNKSNSSPELVTNRVATAAALANTGDIAASISALPLNLEAQLAKGDSTYEVAYNTACCALARGEFDLAEERLNHAKALCTKMLREEGFEDEDIESELDIINIQLAVVYHRRGQREHALGVYNSVLKSHPSDAALVAIASNNIIAIHGTNDLFDSQKKLKALEGEELEKKLTQLQRRIMARNKCLVLLQKGHQQSSLAAFQAACEKLRTDDPAFAGLLDAALLVRSHRADQARQKLETFAKSSNDSNVLLTLAQLALRDKDTTSALHHLNRLQPATLHLPIIVAVRALLGNESYAVQVFQEAVSYWEREGAGSRVSALQHGLGRMLIDLRKFKEAAAVFAKLYAANADDASALAGLISSTSQFDPVSAAQYANSLPHDAGLSIVSEEECDQLENALIKQRNFRPKAEPGAVAAAVPSMTKPKKKKKKVVRLPQGITPETADPSKADPERWLPRKQRSYYKKTKAEKRREAQASLRGTQGVASVEDGNISVIPDQSKHSSSSSNNKKSGKGKGRR